MPNSKQIVYLSQAQYAELIANGTITVDGVTVTYDENDIYVTPQAEPVTDVRMNGTSVTANGIANIPNGGYGTYGVMKLHTNVGNDGLRISDGNLGIYPAFSNDMKQGRQNGRPITPSTQDSATFYGLAKVAGHDEKDSTNTVGTYTPAAKAAIQSMLGVSDLIATAEPTLVASKAYAIGDVFTANGKLYKATTAIAVNDTIVLQNEGETISGANAVETNVGEGFPHDVQVNGTSIVTDGVASIPVATNSIFGVTKGNINQGIGVDSVSKNLYISQASESQVKTGTSVYKPITPANQHVSTFYGLAKAAGDTTQSASDNAVGTYTDDAKAAIRTMLGAVGTEDYATSSTGGVFKTGSTTGTGLYLNPTSGILFTSPADTGELKIGTNTNRIVAPSNAYAATFYGLAKAAGDTTMSSSSNAVGTYTDNAKASIKAMLGIQDGSTGTVDVSGTTPTITAVENTRYVCGEVTSLNFTPAASGICIVRFTSGSTVTVLTVPSTVKFPEWFDSTSLETNTIYEICVTDGVYGAVMSWAL